MTENIFIHGIELVRVTQSAGQKDAATEKLDRRIMKHADLAGIKGLRFEKGLLTSDDGPVYSLHGRRFMTQKQIDAVYPDAVS